MIKNYLKIAFRNLSRNKVFSFINIFGLATGLATCMLIMLYIMDESQYDQSFKDADRIYRVAASGKGDEQWASQPAPVAWALKSEMPDVQEVTRLLKFPNMDNTLLTYERSQSSRQESRRFFEPDGYYVDSTFFDIFDYTFKFGSAAAALSQPNSIVISEAMSEKLFGGEDPVGKVVKVGLPFGDFSYTVTGVFSSAGVKSHIPSNFFLSMRNSDVGMWVGAQDNWTTNNIFHTYVKLRPGARVAVFEKSLTPFFYRHAGAEMKAAGFSKTLFVQPLKDIYLRSQIGNEIAPNGNIKYLVLLGSIAGFILVIACINFMNLSTARSQKRAREVGVRKVLGAHKGALIGQFMGESFVVCAIALFLAVVFVYLMLPAFNHFTHKELSFSGTPELFLGISGLTLFTAFIAGLYPAFYLSSFKPVSVLKGKILNNFSAVAIRKGLVVFQFSVSICLIFAALVIWRQLDFVKKQDLGFAKNQQIVLPITSKVISTNYNALKAELVLHPFVKSVTSGSSYPGIANINDMPFYGEGKSRTDFVDISMVTTEENYLSTLGLTLLEGRPLRENSGDSDTSSLVLNESAVRALGYEVHTAVGRKLSYDFQGGHHEMYIVGVVRNFNFESLHNPIKPLAFSATNFFANKYAYTIVNVQTGNWSAVLPGLEKSWNKINPSMPFSYSFLDQDFARNYEKEESTGRMIIYFMSISVVVACLGLFGLAVFSAEHRTREIGVRKVLGASVGSVAVLLSSEFIKWVVLAILIALPLSAYLMTKWLNDFAYRISLSWWMYFVSAGVAVVIALITVSFQSVKSALSNPVESLHAQ